MLTKEELEEVGPYRPDPVGIDKESLMTFLDAAFAFALTLTAYDIAVPVLTSGTDAALIEGLIQTIPQFMAYAFSFFMTIIYWVLMRRAFSYFVKIDRVILWLVIIFTFLIVASPFSAALLAGHPGNPSVYVFYGILGAIYTDIMIAIWWRGTSGYRLIHPDMPGETIKGMHRLFVLMLLPPVTVSIIAFFSTQVAMFSIIIFYVVFFAVSVMSPEERATGRRHFLHYIRGHRR
ncbi:MAG TPA: TMEM175 family protein [Methanocella sp.]